MSLFDFFKKKAAGNTGKTAGEDPERSNNFYVIDQLIPRLRAKGLKVVKDPQYCSVLVDGDILIATAIAHSPGNHPNVFNLLVSISCGRLFPGDIQESIASLGATFEQQVSLALDNLLDMLLDTFLRSLSDVHNADDIQLSTGSREIRIHTYLGKVHGTGHLQTVLEPHTIYQKLSGSIQDALVDRKFNWAKLYIGKMSTGELYHDCIVNNKPVAAAEPALISLAESLEGTGDLLSARQWVLFRRCDQYSDATKLSRQKILHAVSCFTKNHGSSEQILAELSQLFSAKNEALQYFYFIPMLFYRLKGDFTSGLLSHKYFVRGADGKTKTFTLISNKIYHAISDEIRMELMNISTAHLEQILRYSGERRFLEAAVAGDTFIEGLKFELDFTRLIEVKYDFLFHDSAKADTKEITKLMLTDYVTNRNLSSSKKELENRGFSETYIDFMAEVITDIAVRDNY